MPQKWGLRRALMAGAQRLLGFELFEHGHQACVLGQAEMVGGFEQDRRLLGLAQ